jgi:hypothetical protein
MGSVTASVRHRLALRAVQGSPGEQEWLLRLMPKLAYPVTIAGRTVTLYLADELYYDWTRDAANQNRLYLGKSLVLGQRGRAATSLDGYYLLRHVRGTEPDWHSEHVLGSKLTVKF